MVPGVVLIPVPGVLQGVAPVAIQLLLLVLPVAVLQAAQMVPVVVPAVPASELLCRIGCKNLLLLPGFRNLDNTS